MAVLLTGQHNLAFIHIPKNAGTSIHNWLVAHSKKGEYQVWDDAPTYNEVKSRVGSMPYSFTVVRNPWERAVSGYHYMKSFFENPLWLGSHTQGEIAKAIPFIRAYFENQPSFATWVKEIPHIETWTAKYPGLPIIPDSWQNFDQSQSVWAEGVDTVLRYETLDTDFQQIRDIIGSNDPLPVIKKTNHTNYRDYYDSETRLIIASRFFQDIDTYKYTF
jgi:hypothetical protein